jgi:hypothetical protein
LPGNKGQQGQDVSGTTNRQPKSCRAHISTPPEKLISCLSRNKDVFTWSALDLVGVSRTVIEHSLGIDPSVRPKKQWLRKMSDEKTEAAKAELHRMLEANFIEPITYPTWLAT